LAKEKPPVHDAVCFHCQQAAEKFLKALLQERAVSFRRTHDLLELLALLRPHEPTLDLLKRGLGFLSKFSVEYRYPGHDATGRQAQSAVRWAERVRNDTRRRLGLRVS
jgi:HEPN domain-containing protein